MKNLLLSLTLISVALVAGCDGHQSRHYHHHEARVHAYRTHSSVDNNTFIYWYLLYSSDGSTYYYSSPSRVTNFTSVTFTRSAGALPQNVREQVQEGEDEGEQTLDQAQEPADVAQDEAAMDASQDATSISSESTSSDSSSTSTSSDSSSSSDGGGGSSD